MNQRIKKLRKALDLNQFDFGKRITITKSHMSSIETGHRSVTNRIITDICREYGVNEEWLRTGEGSMFAPLPDVSDDLLVFMQKYNLEQDELTLIQAWLTLSPEVRRSNMTFIKMYSELLTNSSITPDEAISIAQEEVFPYLVDPPATPVKLHRINLIGRVAAGYPIFATGGYDDEFVFVPEDEYENDLVALIIEGDSMTPDYPDGSIVVVKITDNVGIGDLVIATRENEDTGDEEATFKQLASRNGKMVLRALNENYPDQHWNARIFGKVVGVPYDEE